MHVKRRQPEQSSGPARWAQGPRPALTLACLVTVWIAWGGTYPAIRVMVETVPPLLGTSVRFLVAGAVLAVILAAAGKLRAPRREVLGAAAVGTVILGDIGVLAVAEQEVPAGLAALIIASVPLWIVLLQLGAREPVARRTVVAVLAGLAGIGLLVDPAGEAPVGWLLVLVAAAAVEAAGQFFSRSTPLPADPLANSTVQLLAAGLALAAAGLALGEAGDLRPAAFSTDSLLAFAYLVVPGSIVAYSAFTWLLRNAPITTVSTYAYVNPVVAVAAGWALLGERITIEMAVGGAVIVGSVALVIRARR
ncbi:MAG TPA: EamA family transporter [Thermoleophilaceae bacterium]|nr:EamA family transporter [Thermoleophilaceae bacterium]